MTKASRIFIFIALAMLALPLGVSAASSDAPPADSSAKAASDDKAAEDFKVNSDEVKQATSNKKYSANVCEITGVVAKLANVERSPWSDGTPSTLSIYETDIWITVNDRKPHYKNAPADSICNRGAKGELGIYKLCPASDKVAKGDRIHAVEGLRTGGSRSVGCLFDLVVLPPPETATIKKKP